ncbi:hypothetical protein BGZ79_003053, partial [Entomortierella chlamydospora]
MDTTNQSKDMEKSKRNDTETITRLDISWFEESHDKTPAAFFEHFGILKCDEGHLRYTRVLRQSTVNEQERTLLISKFEVWKNSEGCIFWERRNAKVVAEKSAWKTAGNLIEGSEPFAATIMAENAKEQRQRSALGNPAGSGQSSDGFLESTVQESEADGPTLDKELSSGLPVITSSSTQAASSTVGQQVNVPPSDLSDSQEHILTGETEESEIIDDQEKQNLIDSIENSKHEHDDCTWKIGDTCIACKFQVYQKSCIEALYNHELKKTEIADAMAVIGVFDPFNPTPRMASIISSEILEEISMQEPLDVLELDFNNIMKATQLAQNGNITGAIQAIYSSSLDTKTQIMIATL